MMMQSSSDKPIVIFDLDDTLYKEIDYLHSAYRHIADYLICCGCVNNDPYTMMIDRYHAGANVFQSLNEQYGLDIPLAAYLNIYHNHFPNISLDPDTKQLLSDISNTGYTIGIISDGRSITQRNKIAALGLEQYIRNDCIIISEEFGSKKPNVTNYLAIQNLFPDCRFIYIGDNTAKDFVAPNELGWETICLLDDGRNIHKQDYTVDKCFLPKITIESLSQIIQYL